MIDLSAAIVTQVSAHHVGNQASDQGYFLSEQPVIIDQALSDALIEYCSRAFSRQTEVYRYGHDVDLQYNVLNGLTAQYFDESTQRHDVSKSIAQHLYNQSSHPHIKAGDLLIIGLDQVLFADELVEAFAIVKAESTQGFLQFERVGSDMLVNRQEGIQLKRMDKGALIICTDPSEGYRALSVDNNRYDASYWIDDFLSIGYVQDDNFDTKAYVEMCKSFATEVIKEVADKKSQVDFVQQTFNYIDQVEQVDVAEFKEQMFADEATTQAFDDYRDKYQADRGITMSDTFNVSDAVVKQQKQKLRNFIKLDTNIKIQLGFSNAKSVDHLIEKGWDDDKGMYYYKCYFNYES